MTEQKTNLNRMAALLEDLQTVKDFLRTPEEPVSDGQDVWIGLGRLGDLDAGKGLELKPLMPKHKITRAALVAALERHMPQIRKEVLDAIRNEYNNRRKELNDL